MKKDYLQILEENLKSSARRLGLGCSWVFQQDSNPKHASKVVKERLNQATTEVLDWPSRNPDLNPTENMWTVLKKQVCARKPTNVVELLSREVKNSARGLRDACRRPSKAPMYMR